MRPLAVWLLVVGAGGCRQVLGIDTPVRADAAGAVDAPDAPVAPWWDPAFPTRYALHITTSVDLPAGFQVAAVIDLDGGPCGASTVDDGTRIVWSSTDLPRAIDHVLGTPEWIWFRIQEPLAAGQPSGDYWLYCGNPAPTAPPPALPSVFDVFDAFGGTSLGSAWVAQGTVTVAGGKVTLGTGDSAIHSVSTYGAGTAIDFVADITDTSNPAWWGGFELDFASAAPWVVWYSHQAGTLQPSVATASSTSWWGGVSQTLTTTSVRYGVEQYGKASLFRIENVPVERHVYDQDLSTTAFNLRLHHQQGAGTLSFHQVRVRLAVDPPPEVTLGTVETR